MTTHLLVPRAAPIEKVDDCAERGHLPISAHTGDVYCEVCGALIGHEEPLPRAPWYKRAWYALQRWWWDITDPENPF